MESDTATAATNRSPGYEPLRETDEIRLLVLHPGQPDRDIYCSFRHVRLSGKPKYEALSYTWGSEGDQMDISVDGKKHTIRNNLWQALKHLRSGYKKVLWADALCINQEDEQERNHQVSQMREIYTQAQMVRVWLGLEDEGGEIAAAFRHINKPMKLVTCGERLSSPDVHFERERQWRGEDEPEPQLSRLLDLPYWSRLWIIQEIVLAPHIMVQCGRLVCSWTSFSSTISKQYLSETTNHDDSTSSSSLPLQAVSLCATREARLRVGGDETPGLDSLLSLSRRYQDAQCSDVRDKLFGLQSFALPCCREAVPIDYSKSMYHLVGKAVHHHLKHHNGEETQNVTERFDQGAWIMTVVTTTIITTTTYTKNTQNRNWLESRAFHPLAEHRERERPRDWKRLESRTFDWLSKVSSLAGSASDVRLSLPLPDSWQDNLHISLHLVSRVILTTRRKESFPGLFQRMIRKHMFSRRRTDSRLADDDNDLFRRVINGTYGTLEMPSVHDIRRALQTTREFIGPSERRRKDFSPTSEALNDEECGLETAAAYNTEGVAEDCVLYYGSDKHFGFAPSQTRSGDMICKFGNPDMHYTVICTSDHGNRRHERIIRIIGRPGELSSPSGNWKTRPHNYFGFSIEELQLLASMYSPF